MSSETVEIVYRDWGVCPHCGQYLPGTQDTNGFYPIAHQCEAPYLPSHAYVLRHEEPKHE